MRADVERLLKQDGVHLWKTDRSRVETLCSMLEENETVGLILMGQLSVYYGSVPVPEQFSSAVCLTDRGFAVYGKVWHNEVSFRKRWGEIAKFDTSAGKISGVRLAFSDEDRNYIFLENYRGKVSERHKNELEEMKRSYYYKE